MFDLWSPWCHRLLGAVMLLRWQRWKLFLQNSTCLCKNGLDHDRVATQHHLCLWTGVAEEKRSRLSGDYVKLRDIPCPQTRNAIKATIQHLYNICTNILLGRLANPGCIMCVLSGRRKWTCSHCRRPTDEYSSFISICFHNEKNACQNVVLWTGRPGFYPDGWASSYLLEGTITMDCVLPSCIDPTKLNVEPVNMKLCRTHLTVFMWLFPDAITLCVVN